MSIDTTRQADFAAIGSAYGLTFVGSRADADALAPAFDAPEPSWPAVRLRRVVDARAGREEGIDVGETRGRIALAEGGHVALDRERSEALFVTPQPLPDATLVHPLLVYPGSVFGYWNGRHTFHGGGFAAAGGAWALMGARGAGKSSTLGWLARSGHPVLCDDMLVVGDGIAFAGPRTLDLVSETAAYLEVAGAATVRGGMRHRFTIEPAPAALPLRGFVGLAWGDRLAVEPLRGARRMELLAAHVHYPTGEVDWPGVLELSRLPVLELRRPRRLDCLAEAGEALLGACAAADA